MSFAEYHHAVSMLCAIILSVIMLTVIALSVIIQSVIILSATMAIVVASCNLGPFSASK